MPAAAATAGPYLVLVLDREELDAHRSASTGRTSCPIGTCQMNSPHSPRIVMLMRSQNYLRDANDHMLMQLPTPPPTLQEKGRALGC